MPPASSSSGSAGRAPTGRGAAVKRRWTCGGRGEFRLRSPHVRPAAFDSAIRIIKRDHAYLGVARRVLYLQIVKRGAPALPVTETPMKKALITALVLASSSVAMA